MARLISEGRRNQFYLYLTLTCAYALMIFYLSSRSTLPQPPDLMSIEFVLRIVRFTERIGIEFVLFPFYFVYLYLDKFEHMLLYAGFGSLLYLTLSNLKEVSNVPVPVMIIGILYAVTDEIHQSLVPGRLASMADLFADAIGIIFALVAILLYQKFKKYLSGLSQ
ncbi:MAG: VanZ family protein [Halobacteriota archaeon]|nr:VanZ family protein [Halobacteriota archaeon]